MRDVHVWIRDRRNTFLNDGLLGWECTSLHTFSERFGDGNAKESRSSPNHEDARKYLRLQGRPARGDTAIVIYVEGSNSPANKLGGAINGFTTALCKIVRIEGKGSSEDTHFILLQKKKIL